MAIHPHLKQLIEGRASLTQDQAADLMRALVAGAASDVELAAVMGALGARGATADELTGFVQVMRSAARAVPLTEGEQATLVDTCGTGGDGSGSFNISTAAALVAAAAGARVAKHGNRAVTSSCGSADVLEALGIPTELDAGDAATALREAGFCFLLAPAHHPAMRAILPVRRALGVRTIFHVLGPLLNPAGAQRQVVGVYDPRLVPLVAESMRRLGTRHALVVHGAGGMDEFSLAGPSVVAEVRDGQVRQWELRPETLGLEIAPLEALAGGDARRNADLLEELFRGSGQGLSVVERARRDVVLINAAAVLLVAGIADDLREGLARAREALEAGEVRDLLRRLRASAPGRKGTGAELSEGVALGVDRR